VRTAVVAFLCLAGCVTKTVEPLKEESRRPRPPAAPNPKLDAATVRVRVPDLDD